MAEDFVLKEEGRKRDMKGVISDVLVIGHVSSKGLIGKTRDALQGEGLVRPLKGENI